MTTAAIILAAGRGSRMGGKVPKQWRDLCGRGVAQRSVDAFAGHPGIARIVVVVSPDDDPLWWPEAPGILIAHGGASRSLSVGRGLEVAEGLAGVTRVLIHDAARPLVCAAVIDRVLAALDRHPGAAPALAVTDALWRGADTISQTVDRAGVWRAQTPQGFHLPAILAAHRAHPGDAADDVEIARAAGMTVAIVAGDEDNFKLTLPGDFARAERILRGDMDIRTGNGFDVHRFGPGDHVCLCGVRIPHDAGLVGHSDADVGLHALADAIYGALADGDIGRHFPPSDPQWRGAASHLFLSHAGGRAAARGFRIANVDVTLVCEAPRIGPHAPAMRAEMARILGLDLTRVSVKATTSEELGFAGRREGIAALASATLIAP